MTKRIIYISLFILLGILLSFLVHAGIEIPVINLLVSDFDKYSLGLTWDQWFLIHSIGTPILLVLGIYFGWRQGIRWWRYWYVDKKRPKWLGR